MKRFLTIFSLILMVFCANSIANNALAQYKQYTKNGIIIDNKVEINKDIHDFGDVLLSQGPLKYTFKIKNISKKPIVIFSVYTSCGCTNAQWTKAPLKPGESGFVSVVYDNQLEGPFDKVISVYLSDFRTSLIFRIRGLASKKKIALEKLYPYHFAAIALRELTLQGANLLQGSERYNDVGIANISNKKIMVKAYCNDKNVQLEVYPNPIPPHTRSSLRYMIKANNKMWGLKWYKIGFMINGQKVSCLYNNEKIDYIKTWSFTQENFSNWTDNQRFNASRAYVGNANLNLDNITAGSKLTISYKIENKGKSPLIIHKIDCDSADIISADIPKIGAGKSAYIKIRIKADKKKGRYLKMFRLTTNSPDAPVVSLYCFINVK